jgi:GDP-L-fucose synthase
MIHPHSKIWVAGHQGMVGSALIRQLNHHGFHNIIAKTHRELDLTHQQDVQDFMRAERPDCVLIAAGKVGGIYANNAYPADFIYLNLMIVGNVIHQAFEVGVENILYLGSSCIYPKYARQPMAEDALLTGILEPTNEPYAIAKIAGIKLCESYNRQHGTDYRSVMPCNLYGPNDNFHLENSHVIPALMKKIHYAKVNNLDFVDVWGTGTSRREFLHVDDLAAACFQILNIPMNRFNRFIKPMCSHINVGLGEDISIEELVKTLCRVINYQGGVRYDKSKPDGSPQKLMHTALISDLGWRPSYSLEAGLKHTYEWFLANESIMRTDMR